ncbi:carboxymuconolactone decarboxylase family protein [Cellulomonas sp.]|uniref:carboxymuconolactone decarboxylase family protein n=1 Tax=Cellulomonas sp. TaxID=40001 RepID=UPI00258B225F|nr:carboxymuconolactone decarboxylase family protein [Cellulomonas sp.]MCR6688494.1 carboxymuconolactone decarboxylase family protein [Cellulomonas sp.]
MISEAYQAFVTHAPDHHRAWAQAVDGLGQASALDARTQALAYVAVLAAVGNHSGIPFHVDQAVRHGATRAEVVSAVLVGLPAAGITVTAALPAALAACPAEPTDEPGSDPAA